MKTIKSLIAGLGLLGLTAGNALADINFRAEVLEDIPRNKPLVRATVMGELPKQIDGFVFVDFYNDTFFSKIAFGKDLYKGLGSKVELNLGTGLENTLRLGPEYIPKAAKFPKSLFLNFKLYPLTLGADTGTVKEGQLSFFGSWNMPYGFFIENWTDVTFDYRNEVPKGDRRVNVATETTLGKKVAGGLSFEGQLAYNVNYKDDIETRIGLRYDF